MMVGISNAVFGMRQLIYGILSLMQPIAYLFFKKVAAVKEQTAGNFNRK